MARTVRKPNIVLIMADQLAPQFLPAWGHPVVRAPNLDALARDGVVFDAAYTNSPLCAPSRFVMMSGRLPSRIGAWDNAAEFPAEIPTFAHYLAARGYQTCLSGKMHFVGPDQLHGFDERLTSDVYPSDFSWHPDWRSPDKQLDWFHNMEVVTRAGPCLRSMYLDYDDEALFHSQRWLFDRAREGNERPFMLTVSFIQPHDPYLCRPEHWDLYDDADIDMPVLGPGEAGTHPHESRLRDCYGASGIEPGDDAVRAARRAYYGSVSDIDDKVGELVRTLAEAGLADDTVLIFTADHGDFLGERGLWFKMSFLEHSARVPLLVHAPARFAPRRVANAVSLVDLLPTLLDIADDGESTGPEPATPIEGRSLLPHLAGDDGHDEVLGEYFGEGVATPMFMIRRGGSKLIVADGDPVQFFDTANDPREQHNLADATENAGPVAAWMAELDARYDRDRLTERVIESQDRRRFLKDVMRRQGVTWDHAPSAFAAERWVRNTVPIYELEKRGRFPAD